MHSNIHQGPQISNFLKWLKLYKLEYIKDGMTFPRTTFLKK